MTKKPPNRFSPEVQQRAVRMVLEHGGDHGSQWAAIGSIAEKIGCTKLDFPHFCQHPAQKMSSCAIRWSASSIGKTVRPNGPAAAQCCFQCDQVQDFDAIVAADRPQARDRSARPGASQRDAAAAALGEDRASREVEAGDALQHVVDHRAAA